MKRIEPQSFRYSVTKADQSALVTTDDIRDFTIVDETANTLIDDGDAALINLVTASAIEYWINYTGVYPVASDVVAQLDYSPADIYGSMGWVSCIDCWLKYSPILSVTKIWAINDDATEDELLAADYAVDCENGIIRSLDWPSGTKNLGSFNISYKAGLAATAADVPEDVKTCIKQIVTHWFEIRQPTSEAAITKVPHHAIATMNQYKPTSL